MNEIKFLDKIQFNENITPFKKSDEIIFGGQDQIKDLISFYTNDEENAKRFKINCILANNGGGKSRLLQIIYEFLFKPFPNSGLFYGSEGSIMPYLKIFFGDDIFELIQEKDINNIKYNGKIILQGPAYDFGISAILDRFSIGDPHYSINKDIIGDIENDEGLKKFYLDFFNLLINNFGGKTYVNFGDKFNIFIKLKYSTPLDNYIGDINFLKFLNGKYNNIKNSFCVEDFNKIIMYSGKEIFEIINKSINDTKNLKEGIPCFLNFLELLKSEIKDNDVISCITNIIELYNKNNDNIYTVIVNNETKNNKYEYNFLYLIILYVQNNNMEKVDKIYDSIISFLITKKTHQYSFQSKFLNNLSNEEILFIEQNRSFYVDLYFSNESINKSFFHFSSGERIIIIRFLNVYKKIILEYKKGKSNFIILIDEPDLHLHLDWQRQYIQKLIDVFSTIDKDIKMHFILATHSPFIVSDLPNESIVLLQNGKQVKYDGKTFGANYVDLIRDGFFFENKVLIGSFAEKIIGNIAEKRRKEITNDEIIKDIKLVEEIEKQIGDEFLKDNLLYFKVEKDD